MWPIRAEQLLSTNHPAVFSSKAPVRSLLAVELKMTNGQRIPIFFVTMQLVAAISDIHSSFYQVIDYTDNDLEPAQQLIPPAEPADHPVN